MSSRHLAWLAAVLLLAPCGRALPPAHQPTEEELNAKIQRERNPIKRAKLEMKLSHLRLQQAISAYEAQDLTEGGQLLGGYVDEVQSCWKTLQDSGRVASKHSAGFKEFDIALRENLRRLNDLAHEVPYLSDEPIRKAMDKVQSIRRQNFLALFPEFKLKKSEQSASRALRGQPIPHPDSQ